MIRRPCYLAIIEAAVVVACMATAPSSNAEPQPEPPCCASEFDWATDYAVALDNHGLSDLKSQMGIASALAMENACGLVPAIGPVATVDRLAQDYNISPGAAGKLVVAAADVCPEIGPLLG